MKRPQQQTVGGRNQRFRSAADNGQQFYVLNFDSKLAIGLLKEWTLGHISAANLQRHAQQALDDQIELLDRLKISRDNVSQTLKKFASFGCNGTYPGKCHSELIAFLGEPDLPACYQQKVPMQVHKGNITSLKPDAILPIALPHEIFSHLYHNDKALFEDLFLGDVKTPDSRVQFWSELERRGDPRLRNHPVQKFADWKTTTLPLAFHGDGVPVLQIGKANAKTLDVYSIQSMFCKLASSLLSKILLTCIFVESRTDGTEAEIWKVLLWSLHWLYIGKWPHVDHNFKAWEPKSSQQKIAGTYLADGLRAIIYGIKGDLDFFAKTLGLRHYNANDMCELCPAHRNIEDRNMCYNNFAADAKWKRVLFTYVQWLAIHLGVPPHFVFQILGVTHYCLEPDELHIIYLGTAQYLLGSVLWLLVFVILSGDCNENMSKVWSIIEQEYRHEHSPAQYSTLSIRQFSDAENPGKHYPKLKGKGAEVKHVVGPILRAWTLLVPDTFEQKAEISAVLETQLAMQSLLHDYSDLMMLPLAVVKQFRSLTDNFSLRYQRLAARADSDGLLLWSQPTKFHWLWHLAERSQYLNPRRGNCMMDEDFVGHMKDIAAACADGTPLHNVPPKTIAKYMYGFSLLHKLRAFS